MSVRLYETDVLTPVVKARDVVSDYLTPGVGSILDKVAKDIEDTANLYLYLYLRYIFGQPVSYQYLKILDEAKDKISFCKLAGISIV